MSAKKTKPETKVRTYKDALACREAMSIARLCVDTNTPEPGSRRERATAYRNKVLEVLRHLFEADIMLQHAGAMHLLYEAAQAKLALDGWPDRRFLHGQSTLIDLWHRKKAARMESRKVREMLADQNFQSIIEEGKVAVANIIRVCHPRFSAEKEKKVLWDEFVKSRDPYQWGSELDVSDAAIVAHLFKEFTAEKAAERTKQNRQKAAKKARATREKKRKKF